MLQLNPSIPVMIVGKGTGEAIGWFDYSKEDHLMWLVALDEGGEVWLVPNTHVRLRLIESCSIGRTKNE